MSKEEVQFANLESRDRFEILAARHLRIPLPSIESIRDRDDYRSTGVSDLWQFWQVIASAEANSLDRLEGERAEQWRLRRDAEADRDTKAAVIAELRAELGECKGEYDRAVNKVDALRDQLAERDELIGVMLARLNKAQIFGYDRNVKALSASAEPSKARAIPAEMAALALELSKGKSPEQVKREVDEAIASFSKE